MNITDNEILHNIIEMQACVIQGRSLKALFHLNTNFYLQKSGADIITIYLHEHKKVNLEYIIEEHRVFAHLMHKYILSKKKLKWSEFVQNCENNFVEERTLFRIMDLHQLFKGILTQKETDSFNQELQMKEAVLMPIYAFDQKEKIGYICFIFKTAKEVDLKKLENVQHLFQALMRPLYDTNHNMIYSKCTRIDENMWLLTDQEKRIVRKMLSGQTYPEIAKLLDISINTLKTHMKHIFNKYNVSSKVELLTKLGSPV